PESFRDRDRERERERERPRDRERPKAHDRAGEPGYVPRRERLKSGEPAFGDDIFPAEPEWPDPETEALLEGDIESRAGEFADEAELVGREAEGPGGRGEGRRRRRRRGRRRDREAPREAESRGDRPAPDADELELDFDEHATGRLPERPYAP